MPVSRTTYMYHFIQGDKIVHIGTTPDLFRLVSELEKEFGSGHIKEIGCRTTLEKAKAWEREERKKYNLEPIS